MAKNENLEILQETLQMTHLPKLLDKMCKYEMDPTRTVGATGRTDGRSETNIPPTTLLCGGWGVGGGGGWGGGGVAWWGWGWGGVL